MKKKTKQEIKAAGAGMFQFLATHKGWRWLLIGLAVGFGLGAWVF